MIQLFLSFLDGSGGCNFECLQTVCRMTVDGGVQSDGEIQKERTLFEESAPFVILTVYYLAAEFEVEPVITNVVASAVSAVTRLDLQ